MDQCTAGQRSSFTVTNGFYQDTKSDTSATIDNEPTVVSSPSATIPLDPQVSPIYPDGGTVAWLNVLGAFFVQISNFGYTTSFGVYQDYYTRVYLTDTTSSAISWIGSINAFLVVAFGICVGHLFDRGYFYYLLYGGAFLTAFSLFMHSLAQPGAYYQILLSQGIGVGLGSGMLYVPTLACVSQHFSQRRPLALTFVASGASLGAVVHPIMLNNTLPTLGFAHAARANAGLVSGLLLLGCVLMRLRVRPEVQRAQAQATAREQEGGGERRGLGLWRAAARFVCDAPYVSTTLGMMIFIIPFYYPLFYLQLDSLKHGLSTSFSFYALVIMNSSSFVGRLSAGPLATRWGVDRMTLLSTTLCTAFIFCMLAIRDVGSVVGFALVYGFFSGVYCALFAPLIAMLTSNMSELGARMGISFFFCGIGSLIGTPIDGALLTGEFVWWRPTVFSGAVGLLGSTCYAVTVFLLRERHPEEQCKLTRQDHTDAIADKSARDESAA